MPRLRPQFLLRAQKIHVLLPLLLRHLRTLPSAIQELKYLLHELPSPSSNSTSDTFLPNPSHPRPFSLSPLDSAFRLLQRRRDFNPATQLAFKLSPRSRSLVEAALLRARGYPLQYVLGTQPFLDLDIVVDKNVLIPRPETEAWTAEVIFKIHARIWRTMGEGRKALIIDACSGSGCIGLAIAKKLGEKGWVLALEKSAGARRNSRRNREVNEVEGWEVREGDVFDVEKMAEVVERVAAERKVEPMVLVSNPPYIFHEELYDEGGVEARGVRSFEPRMALFGDDDFYPPLIELAGKAKFEGVVMEVGSDEQAGRVKLMLQQKGWEAWSCKDYRRVERVVMGWKKGGWEDLATPSRIYF